MALGCFRHRYRTLAMQIYAAYSNIEGPWGKIRIPPTIEEGPRSLLDDHCAANGFSDASQQHKKGQINYHWGPNIPTEYGHLPLNL